jgi:hypothetical protein
LITLSLIDILHDDVTLTNNNALPAFFSLQAGDGGQGFDFGELISASQLSPVPLPAALPLFGSGVMVLAGVAWRRKGKVS